MIPSLDGTAASCAGAGVKKPFEGSARGLSCFRSAITSATELRGRGDGREDGTGGGGGKVADGADAGGEGNRSAVSGGVPKGLDRQHRAPSC